jgi:hypothetical protein
MNARASVVNRTHRVVREQALAMREQRSRSRSLWLPIAICSPLLLLVCYAIYDSLETGEFSPTGVADGSGQLFLLMIWLLPVTAFLVGLVLFRLGRNRSQQERML